MMIELIKKNFDYQYYIEKYPDIKENCKTYEDCIWHFCGLKDLNNVDKILNGDGMKEKRLFNKKLEELENYGYDKYIIDNLILENKKIIDVQLHFLDNYEINKLKFKNEIDNITKYFDIEFYKQNYPDLKNFTELELKTHFINNGKKEGRLFNEKLKEFDKKTYLEENKETDKYLSNKTIYELYIYFLDNYDKFKLKQEKLKQEKIKQEKLKFKNEIDNITKYFDIEFYKQNYPDLKNFTELELKTHFINNGKKEGRLFNEKLKEFDKKTYLEENKETDKYLSNKTIYELYIYFLDNYDKFKLKQEKLKQEKIKQEKLKEEKLIIYHICHNFGGGTLNYVNNLINILNQYKHIILYTHHFNEKENIILDNKNIIFVHSYLYNDENKLLNINYNIHNQIKYYNNKYLIIHDYFLIYPHEPNIINYKKPIENDIKYLNKIFLDFKKVIFNTKFCYDFYNKYLNIDNINDNNSIILNDVPDIKNINNDIDYYLKKKNLYNIGIIGHVDNESKGTSLCHKIFKNHNNGKYKFIIFGDGNSFNNYSNVYVYGKYNNKYIFNLINHYKIDFFIFTSLFEETYSYTLSIELSTGLPIVYYDRGCVKERINNKENCISFKDENINLDNIIVKLIKNTNTNTTNKIINNYLLKNNLSEFNYYLNNEYYFNIKNEDICTFKNVCFYHFCNINNGYNIFVEQMNNLKKTKLYDKLDKIYISFLGDHIKLNLDSKMEIIYYSENINEMELNVHKCIYKFCCLSNNNINILYFHSKGVLKKPNSENWRKYLEYFLIKKHEDCLKLLEENIDSVGANANIFTNDSINKNRNHFSGNFWWSTSKYIKNLKFNLNINDRFSVEHYIIGSNRTKNIISLHNINKNLYDFKIEPNMYNLEIIRSNILNSSTYNNKIIGLYFICAINSYKYRIDKQIKSIIDSKLYDNCHIILCYIIAKDIDANYIKNVLKNYNKFILIITDNFNMKENYLFNNYKNYFKYNLKLNIEKFNFFYIHNKGSSYNIKNKPIDDWCDLNNYFTINKWNLNVKLLKYYDCVGVNYKFYPLRHYSGNFWWTTGNHLSKLKNTIGDKYLDPEMYLMNNVLINNKENNIYIPNIICLYKSIQNHAAELYSKQNYINLSDFDIIENISNIPFINSGDLNSTNINNITFNDDL